MISNAELNIAKRSQDYYHISSPPPPYIILNPKGAAIERFQILEPIGGSGS